MPQTKCIWRVRSLARQTFQQLQFLHLHIYFNVTYECCCPLLLLSLLLMSLWFCYSFLLLFHGFNSCRHTVRTRISTNCISAKWKSTIVSFEIVWSVSFVWRCECTLHLPYNLFTLVDRTWEMKMEMHVGFRNAWLIFLILTYWTCFCLEITSWRRSETSNYKNASRILESGCCRLNMWSVEFYWEKWAIPNAAIDDLFCLLIFADLAHDKTVCSSIEE